MKLMDYFLIKKVSELQPHPLNKELFDDLKSDNYEALKLDIQKHGIKTELHILQNGLVLCGHQRLRIAKELHLPTVPIKFINIKPDNIDEIKKYMITDNVLRRHLSLEQWNLHVADLSILEEKGRGTNPRSIQNLNVEKDAKLASFSDNLKEDVNIIVAKQIGVSPRTVARARQYKKIITERPELKKEKIHTALKKYKKEKKQQAIQEEVQKLAQTESKNKNFTLLEGEAKHYLLTLPDHSIDCVITDPPYGIETHNTREGIKDFDDGLTYIAELLTFTCEQLKRIVNENGHLYFFCGSDIKLLYLFYSILKNYFEVQEWPLIWVTNNHTICNYEQQYPRKMEFILFAKNTKGKDRPLNFQCTPNILEFSKVREKDRLHITEKPVKLLEKLLKNSSFKGETLLDPFAGSGSLGEACLKNNRKVILIEKEQKYCDIIKFRLKDFSGGE